MKFCAFPALALTVVLTAPASAQPRPDPDWPCVQRKVPTIGVGAVWSGPRLEEAGPWGSDFEAAALAQKLASRRTPVRDIESLVDAFAREAGAPKGPPPTPRFSARL